GLFSNWPTLSGYSGNINSIAIHPTNPNKLAIATNSSDKIYVSTDGGTTWTSMLHDLPNFAALALVWDTTYNEDVLYLGMNYGVYYLRENTTSWVAYNTGLPNVFVNELEVNTADDSLYAASYGRGLWRVDLYNPNSAGLDEFEVSDLEVSPNPSTGIFNLYWKLNKSVTIKIYDSLGKLVFYEKNRDLSQNSEIELRAPKGLYFLKVNTTHSEVTKKLIVK
ncbi:T9SS type A sorting domain-containing protein, partial [Flavobacteriaceae bacterium]|nr:T9SS type A sorting domain-containing protein [Flavobacteriaceae bacterium]